MEEDHGVDFVGFELMKAKNVAAVMATRSARKFWNFRQVVCHFGKNTVKWRKIVTEALSLLQCTLPITHVLE